MRAGRFITVEGIEGAGKSTQLAFIRDVLQAAGKRVILTREPGGTGLGEEIRALLLAHRAEGMAADTELLLMFAARAEHLYRVIHPALASGDWVLCDRFTDSTYAYQGGGRGISMRRIETLEDWVQGGLRPDLTLLLDLPVEEGLIRAGRRNPADRFEGEDFAFFQGVRQAYLELAGKHPQRYRIIDASRPVEAVRINIEEILNHYLSHEA